MSDAEVLCCTWPFCSWLLLAPQSCICYFPLIARANSLVVWKFKSIQQHWWGDTAIHWFWQHPWYTRCIRCVHVRIRTSSSKHILHPLHVLHQILVCSNVVPMSCFAEIKHVSLVTSQTALRFRDLFILCFSWSGFLPKCLFPKMIVSYVLMGARCLLCSIHVPSLGQIRWKTMKKHTMW